MGLEKVGMNIAQRTATYVKACGKRSILETKPSIFHGINPTITYPPSGKVYELPRFCTQEMKQARSLNKIAIRQLKEQINTNFPKATAEDLKRLTSETIEDSYSRIQWTNPKDGKIYNLLKQGETKDGKVIIRILDHEGAFIKEATIKPKEIAIIDNSKASAFELPFGVENRNLPIELNELSHAQAVEIFAKRSNPFAKYTIFETGIHNGSSAIDNEKVFSHLHNLQQGKKYDYVNCSFGSETFDVTESSEPIYKKICSEIDKLNSKRGTRVLFASGNSDGGVLRLKGINRFILNSNTVEGVGSLNKQGTISSFTSSRNSKFCQHYEQGEFSITQTPNGFNITGQSGTDVFFYEKNPFVGMKLGDILKKCDENPEMWKYMQKLGFKNGGECMDDTAFLFFPNGMRIDGTSFATPIRTAKLALNDMMDGIL